MLDITLRVGSHGYWRVDRKGSRRSSYTKAENDASGQCLRVDLALVTVAVVELPSQVFVPGIAGHGGKNQQVKPASGDGINGLIEERLKNLPLSA
jgi:hypothetical protein